MEKRRGADHPAMWYFFSKAITKTTLQYVLKTGINNGVDGMFLPVIALWDYIQATGDWQILDETWADAEYSINSVNGFFDDDLHLLQVERSTSNDAFPEKETGGYALSIQVYYSAALRAAANLARIRNQWEKAAAWDTRAQAVVKAVKSCIGMKLPDIIRPGRKEAQPSKWPHGKHLV